MQYLSNFTDDSSQGTSNFYEELLTMILLVFRYLSPLHARKLFTNTSTGGLALVRGSSFWKVFEYITKVHPPMGTSANNNDRTTSISAQQYSAFVRLFTEYITILLELELEVEELLNIGTDTINLTLPHDSNAPMPYATTILRLLLQEALHQNIIFLHRSDGMTATIFSVLATSLRSVCEGYELRVKGDGNSYTNSNTNDEHAAHDKLRELQQCVQIMLQSSVNPSTAYLTQLTPRHGWDIENNFAYSGTSLASSILLAYPTREALFDALGDYKSKYTIEDCEALLQYQYQIVVERFLVATETILFIAQFFAP